MTEADADSGAPPVIVISEPLRQRLYGESVKRSSEMLKPTKIGGYFVHPSSTR